MNLKNKRLHSFREEVTLPVYLVLVFFLFSFYQGTAQIASVSALDNQATETPTDNGIFRISLSGVNAAAISVNYIITGTATPGDDFASPGTAGTAVVPAFTSFVDVSVSGIVDDNLVEDAETVVIELVNGPGYLLGLPAQITASIEILDNDKGVLSVDLLSVAYDPDAAEAGLDQGLFRINLSNPNATSGIVTVNYTVSGTAIDGTDYNLGNAVTLTFLNNGSQVNRNITVLPIQDFIDEIDETVTITLDSSSDPLLFPIDLANNTGTVIIVDNDTAGFIVSSTTGITSETGTTSNFLFTLTSEPTAAVTVPINGYDNTEHSGPTSVILNSSNWNTGVNLAILGLDDNSIDGDQTYELNTGNPSSSDLIYDAFNDTAIPQLNLTNSDDDVAGVTASIVSGNTNEGGGGAFFTFTLNSMPTDDVTITLSSSDATEGTVPSSVTVSPANWDTGANVIITGVDDSVVDGDVSFMIVTGNITSSDINYGPITGAQIANVSVTNDDNDTPGVLVSPNSGSTNESGTTASFLFTLNSEPTANVTIPINGYNNTEHSGPASVVLTPSNWNTGVSLVVTGLNDLIVDGDVTYTLNTGNVTSTDSNYNALNGTNVAQISLTNEDDDSASIAIADASANEDVVSGNLVFDVTLDIGIVGGTTVTYTFSDASAIGGNVDYDSTGGSITFVGTTGEVQQISVTLNDDAILENSEEFTVQLGTPTNGVSITGGNIATGTINDDDNCVPAPILDTSVSTFFCDEIDQSLNTFTNSSAPSGAVLTWSTLSEPLNVNAHLTLDQVANPPNDGSFFGFFYDETNNCASGTIEVVLTLNDSPIITDTQGEEVCGPAMVVMTVEGNIPNSVQDPTFNWYDSPTLGNLVDTGDTITLDILVTTTYYVEAVANGCVTERVAVTATIYPLPSAGIPIPNTNSACSDASNGPTLVDLDELLDGESLGVWTITTDPSNLISIDANNEVDFENSPDGSYIFNFTTTDATFPFCENLSSEVTITVNDCDVDTDLDGLFDGVEITLGTAVDNVDSDEDGIEDAEEVGSDIANPKDSDEDGIIDALDSNVLDADMDGVVDQSDPANSNPCIPDNSIGLCDTDGDGISDGDEITNGSDPLNPCDPNLTPDCEPEPIDLEILKEVDKPIVLLGESVVFTISVNNLSDSKVLGIKIGDLLETGFEYVSHSPITENYSSETGIWDILEMQALETMTLKITAIVMEGENHTNTAELLESFPIDDILENNLDTIEVRVSIRTNNECGFLFNQFSPNGDGTNDYLVINCILEPEYANNTFEIYDRYGNQVFNAKGYDNKWDGTKDNKDLPKGTYFYILDIGDGSDVQKGWIQIIR